MSNLMGTDSKPGILGDGQKTEDLDICGYVLAGLRYTHSPHLTVKLLLLGDVPLHTPDEVVSLRFGQNLGRGAGMNDTEEVDLRSRLIKTSLSR